MTSSKETASTGVQTPTFNASCTTRWCGADPRQPLVPHVSPEVGQIACRHSIQDTRRGPQVRKCVTMWISHLISQRIPFYPLISRQSPEAGMLVQELQHFALVLCSGEQLW